MTMTLTFRNDFEIRGSRLEVLFVYCPAPRPIYDVERSLAQDLAKGRISPDLIVFAYPQPINESIQKLVENEALKERFNQIDRLKAVMLAPFDETGNFGQAIFVVGGDELGKIDLKKLRDTMREGGLRELVSSNGVITHAPAGAYFRNPSSAPKSYFIRASLLCRSSVEASFLASCLLGLLARASNIYGGKIPNRIWVDTVAIMYVAYGLIDLGRMFGLFEESPQVRSFSSYAGYKTLFPNSGEYPIWLISASTSGRLARDIVSEGRGRIFGDAVCTLVGAYVARYPDVLYVIPEEARGDDVSSPEMLREIRVSGEDFIFSPSEVKSVTLKRTHRHKHFEKMFDRMHGADIVHHFKRNHKDRPPRPFFLDAGKLVKQDSFLEWVVGQTKSVVPACVGRIVYQDDSASKHMAKLVARRLRSSGLASAPPITSTRQLKNLPACKNETVVVVAAVVGSGMELMRVTKELRRYQPEGGRCFVLGLVSCRTYAQIDQLRSNLEVSSPSLRYVVSTWAEFAPAPGPLQEYRDREVKLVSELRLSAKEGSKFDAWLTQRSRDLRAEGLVQDGEVVQCPFVFPIAQKESFRLTRNFALWKEVRKRDCSMDVLFTVACWLQNAREGKGISEIDRLDGGGFHPAVISPDNFLRFTDAVIQAAILRCARDSELDYRSSPELSSRAGEIVVKLVDLKEGASAEFLLAIALGRLKMLPDQLDAIVKVAGRRFRSDPLMGALVKAIGDRSLHTAATK